MRQVQAAWRQRNANRSCQQSRFRLPISRMSKVLTRNVALFGGMIVAGLVCARAAPFLSSTRGEHGPTIMAAERPVVAALALMLALAVTTALACVIGRFVNAAVGLFVLGAGVFVLDDRLAGIRELVYAHPGRSTLFVMGIETLVLAIVALAMVLIVFRLTGGFHDVEPDVHGNRPHWLTSDAALKSAASGLLIIPAVWLIAQSPLKGQAIAAVFIGAMLAGLVGRLLAPHVQPILVFVSPMIFGALGQIAAAALTRMPLDEAYINGSLNALARPMPLDYLAGSLLGVSFGLGWAKSFLHHEEVVAAQA